MTEPSQQPLSGQPKSLSTESYGLSIIAVSALLYSVMGAFVKMATLSGLPSTEVVFMRAVFQGTLVVAAMLGYKELPSSYDDSEDRQDPKLLIFSPLGNARIRPIVIARGALGGCGFVLYFYTISALPLGDAVALLSLSPVVTVWATAAFDGVPLRPLHILAACTTVFGSFLVARPDFIFGPSEDDNLHLSGYNPLGYCTAVGGCFSGAGVFLLMRKAGKSGAHTLQLLFSWVVFGLLFSSLLGVALPLSEGKWSWTSPSSPLIWAYILGCCFFGTIAHFLLNFAARHSNPGLASIVRSSGIVWAYLLQILLFDQIPTRLTCVGVIFVGLSLMMVSIQKMLDRQTEESDTKSEEDEKVPLALSEQYTSYGNSA